MRNKSNDGMTHWAGCDQAHVECAKSALARQVLAEIELVNAIDGMCMKRVVESRVHSLFTRLNVETGE